MSHPNIFFRTTIPIVVEFSVQFKLLQTETVFPFESSPWRPVVCRIYGAEENSATKHWIRCSIFFMTLKTAKRECNKRNIQGISGAALQKSVRRKKNCNGRRWAKPIGQAARPLVCAPSWFNTTEGGGNCSTQSNSFHILTKKRQILSGLVRPSWNSLAFTIFV